MPEKIDNGEALKRLQQARKALDDAFASAVTTEEMRDVYRGIRALDDEIVVLVRKAMEEANEEYSPVTDAMRDINTHLKKLRGDIDRIVFVAKTAADIVNALTKVISMLP